MAQTVKVYGICGSLRRDSLNRKLLCNVLDLLPENVALDIGGLADDPPHNIIGDIPLYNQDIRDEGIPDAVAELSRRVEAADALLIVTPEYNHSMPGVFKNAIDWLSRQDSQPLADKPFSIMGAAPGPMGSVRSQMSFRQTSVFLDMRAWYKPEVMVTLAAKKFSDDGTLTDETARELITKNLAGLRDFVIRLRK